MNNINSHKNINNSNNISYEQLMTIADCMSDYVLLASEDYQRFHLNKNLRDLLSQFGVSRSEVFLEIFGVKNRNSLANALVELEKEGSACLDLQFEKVNGKLQTILFSLSRVPGIDGQCLFITGQDISHYQDRVSEIRFAMQTMEAKLDDKNKDLALARDRALAASRAKSGFLANMSHELRTPLNAVIGYAEIMMEDFEDSEHQQYVGDLKRIQNAGKHLLSLINDILDLSKIEAGKMGLNLEYFRVDGMVEEVLDTIQPMALKNNTQLKLIENPEVGVMLSDITKVRQILFNLISNGIKFSENGQVEVQCYRKDVEGKEHIFFEVTDTGIGMSPEDLEKLFEEFFQVDNSNAKKWSGTGLGLVISQRFAQMMGGSIAVRSELGEGSTFTVNVPVNTAKIRFQDSPDGFIVGPKIDPRLVRFSGKAEDIERRDKISRVLVIDDDPDVRDLMERYLSREGFEVTSVNGGQEGIAKVKEFQPDVITLDVLMPVMDGWSVLSELKKDPETAAVPVIMLSMLDELDMSFALGASDYLLKPINRDLLVDTVLKHIRDKENAMVLVVDDQDDNRNMISRVLNSHKINVITAENGVEALSCLEKQRPDLILLDLMMPEMDGFRFSEIAKQDEHLKDIPIVVLTAQELSTDDISRLSGKVERIYEKKGTDFETLLTDIQKIVTSKVRDVYQKKSKE